MISVGFSRVSKQRPCRICGKPTYCGFSRDEGTSICMCISAGSCGLSRNGGNVVEVKKTRSNLRDNEVGKELIVDIERYKARADPDHYIRNPKVNQVLSWLSYQSIKCR